MASLSLYPQFETNLMSNRKVIELLLQLKSAKAHGKTTYKSNHTWSTIFSVIVYFGTFTIFRVIFARIYRIKPKFVMMASKHHCVGITASCLHLVEYTVITVV